MPLARTRNPDDDSSTLDSAQDDYPVKSITSINSLTSFPKEKLQRIPSKIKKKTPSFKIAPFVGFLFLCIVFFGNQQVLAQDYFNHIKFNETSRIIKIFNTENIETLLGHLGTTLGSAKADNCSLEDEKYDESMCLKWSSGARLYINKEKTIFNESATDIRCYTIKWKSLVGNVHPTDCYDLSPSLDHWYGGGQLANMTWPLGKGNHTFAPFITGGIKKHHWSNALIRYFITSKGAAIIIDNETPLCLSINNDDKKLCLQARHDDFAYANHLTEYPELKYKICTSSDMKHLQSSLNKKSLWDGLKKKDNSIMISLLTEPVWHIAPKKNNLIESMIYNYTLDIMVLGFLKQGHILINEYWQDHIGDFTVDESQLQSLVDIIKVIHRRGFKIVFTIQPFISTESKNFAECVQKRLLVSQKQSDGRIPALTPYKHTPSAGMLDFTNNKTGPWLQDKLKKLIDTYDIDAFFADIGTAYSMPHHYQCNYLLNNLDEYKTTFINTLEPMISLIGVSSTVSLPNPPTFVSLPPFESTWEAIRTVIPTILSYGVIGYPFIMPGAVGGDIDPLSSEIDDVLPEKELYLRWLQMATFLPVIKFTHLPSKYNDEQLLRVAKDLTNLRVSLVTPLLIEYKEQALENGLPLIRPLWMLEPNDPTCLVVDDEFSVGEELIVAPILKKGSIVREVYLPSGVWKDGIDGSLRKGSRWIHEYIVPLDKVAYFQKMPDDTRF